MATEKIGLEAVLKDEDFQKGLAMMIKSVDKVSKKMDVTARKSETAAKKTSKGWKASGKQVKSALTGMAVGFASVGAAALLVSKALAFGQRGAQVTQTAQSFDGLIRSVGASADTLQRLRDATGGTVDDMTLMSSTTTLLAGAQGDLAQAMAGAAPQLAEIAKAANKLNPTLGDTAFLYQSLGTGIKRSSPLILDNLGLTIKIGEANERYAEKLGKTVAELSAVDKQQALLEETLRAGNVLIEQAGGSTDSATDSFARLGTSVKNLTDHLAATAAPAISDFADALNQAVFHIFEAAEMTDMLVLKMVDAEQIYGDYARSVLEAAVANNLLTQEEAYLVQAMIEGDEAAEKQARSMLSAREEARAYAFAAELLTKEQHDLAAGTRRVSDAIDDSRFKVIQYRNELGDLVRQEEDAVKAAKELEDAQKALAKAVDDVRKSFEGFYGTLAGGIIGLRDLDKAAVDSAKSYEDALDALGKSAGKSYKGIRDKYEDSLPDATTVDQRMGMAADAWDEFGLRAEDVIQRGAESPWWGQLEQELMAVGETRPPDVGIQEWMSGVKQAFYDGDLPGLINEDAAGWQAHAEAVKAAQAEEAAAVRQANAEKKAAIEEAREAQLAAEKEARERATVELALSLAEQTGQLQAWSAQKFGPDFSQVGDTAAEVMGLLDAGILEIDTGLGNLITRTAGGVADALDLTGQQAEDTKAQFEGLLDPAAFEQQTQVMNTMLEQMGEGPLLEIEEDPFLPITAGFPAAMEAVVTGAATMDEAVMATLTNMGEGFTGLENLIMEGFITGSVFPEMILGMDGMTLAWGEDIDEIETEWSDAADAIHDSTEDLLDFMTSEWHTFAVAAIQDVKDIVDELDEIPREIIVKVKVETEDGDAQHGAVGVAGQTFLVGEAGPELFTMPGAGMIIPNDISMNILSQVPALQAPQGPSMQLPARIDVLRDANVTIASPMDLVTLQASMEQGIVAALRRGS